jgi:hypothetical protein
MCVVIIVESEHIPAMCASITQAIHERKPFAMTPYVRRQCLPSRFRTPQEFFDAVGARVLTTEGNPRYCPLPKHEILMPPVEWLGLETWQSCLAHELLHLSEVVYRWHEPSWKTELRAEIGQSVVEVFVGLPPCSDHTNIIKWFGRWEQEITADPHLAMTATSSAIEGVKYLIKRACFEQSPEQKETEAALMEMFETAKRELAG